MRGYTRREWLIILALSLGSFTVVLNVYLLTPFLKLVGAEFGVSQSAVGQLSTTYALAAGGIGLLAAPLMDRYQRKRLLQLGLLIVTAGTALSAVAWTFPILFLARAIAGSGAAVMGSASYAAASDAFPDLDKRNRCVGILLSATGIAAVIGIPILTELATITSWRWAVASLILPLLVVVAGVSVLPERDIDASRPLVADYLARYRRVLQHGETTYLLLAGLVRSIIWTVPLIYSVAIWIGLFHVSLRGYGWVFLVGGLTYFIGSNLAPAALRRFPARGVVVAGTLSQMVGALGFTLMLGRLIPAVLLYCGIFCFAGAFVSVALNILLQDSLPEVRGAVLSLSATTNQAGSAVAGIVGGIILAGFSAGALLPLASLLTPLILVAVWQSTRVYPQSQVVTAAGD